MMRLLAIGYPTMLISGLIVSASVAQTLDSVESVLCPNVVAQTVTEVEGETFACGVVRVPADYDDPEGRQIELMYGVLRSTSLSPATDPVIYLHGGPGGGELASMTNVLAERLATLRTRRDIFIFDQRGSGFSPAPHSPSRATASS